MINNNPTLLIVLFTTCLLVPTIPAIIIYLIFPRDKITVAGALSNFTINATGGFAAYVFTVVLGFYMINQIPTIIRGIAPPKKGCTLRAKILFKDKEGHLIDPPDPDLLNTMKAEYEPPIKSVTSEEVRVIVPHYVENSTLELGLEGFKSVKKRIVSTNEDADTVALGTFTFIQQPLYTVVNQNKLKADTSQNQPPTNLYAKQP